MKLIKAYQGNAPVLLQMWAMQVLRPAFLEANNGDTIGYNNLIDAVMSMKSHCSIITNTLAMPIPFAYYHICVVLMYFTFTIFSIILVAQESPWTILFLFMIIFCINILAFATSSALLVGANVSYYLTIMRSFLTLLRALVGDYDLDEMSGWSVNYLVEWFFIVYMFACIFIFLSFFFAIHSVAQSKADASSSNAEESSRPDDDAAAAAAPITLNPSSSSDALTSSPPPPAARGGRLATVRS